ncbi:MAG: efflux RND transporter periplasmic adaptor subunit [Acidobacteriota bacterium]
MRGEEAARGRARIEDLRIDREDRPVGSPLLRLGLPILLLAVVAVMAWMKFRPSPRASVTTVQAREQRAGGPATVLNASGYVTARRKATVSSKITGKVVELLIEEGMEVQEGQILARLDDSNVRASLRLAEAQFRAARAALAETEVLLKDARRTEERVSNLAARGISTQADLDAANARAASLKARLRRQQDDMEVARKQVEVWQQAQEDTVIRAPFSGIIVAKNAQPGEMISPTSAGGGFTRTGIGTLVDMDSLEIEVDVNESYINRVAPGQKVISILDAYPQWRIPSHVIAIIPTADRQRATVQVRVGFKGLDPRILPDMGVKVAFQSDRSDEDIGRGGVLVPASAVRHEQGRAVVLVVKNRRVERRAISVGVVRDRDILITAGLTAGESVVTKGPHDLADGQEVEESAP